MKEFVVYTALRLALLFASFVVVAGGWALITGVDRVPLLPALLISFLISGVASYYLLNRPREAFARRVEHRAERAAARFEEMKSREDAD
ncbi:DUF4229 domain-containing protein [Nocardioides sp.]|uniref:DUF4229 domain-containing protein n=1 Tax=Nocardioides sp. TaxID=35761 RepID=UPI0027356260|nr:DUF4229 domain-containing protein [Nocardioides sp.]MDP3890653.1 DUF4229 domain-containing protein [Nocardioides sp.]